MEIAKTIQEYRRIRGLTQEQLAERVGVSAPAVSKWETGASLPDITLLAPIARVLGITIDQLLSFQALPDEKTVNTLERECAELFARQGYEAGQAQCEKLLREYPNSNYLRLRIASLYQRFLVTLPETDKEEAVEQQLKRIRELFRQVYEGGDGRLRAAATVSLASHALMSDDLEQAEALLSELPRMEVDPDELYPLLYLKRGERERAAKLLEERVYCTAGEALRALNQLTAIAVQDGGKERALACSRASAKLVQTLHLLDVTGYMALLKLLCERGEAEEAAAAAVEYLHRVAALSLEKGHPLFPHLELRRQPEQIHAVQRTLLTAFEQEAAYDSLRVLPQVRSAVEALRRAITEQDG